eukprot:m.416862 g.416862  ORF g.416862 m.416862 type:complete len:106 (+) comp30137_c0_seq1:395-712(+)
MRLLTSGRLPGFLLNLLFNSHQLTEELEPNQHDEVYDEPCERNHSTNNCKRKDPIDNAGYSCPTVSFSAHRSLNAFFNYHCSRCTVRFLNLLRFPSSFPGSSLSQ